MDDLISRKAAMKTVYAQRMKATGCIPDAFNSGVDVSATAVDRLPSAQPQYEELTPEEAASEIASGSIMSARYWLDAMIRLKQMGYAICRKR